jgi:hypothetical protein
MRPEKACSIVKGWLGEFVAVWRYGVGSSVMFALWVDIRAYRRAIALFCSSHSIEGRAVSANQTLSAERR